MTLSTLSSYGISDWLPYHKPDYWHLEWDLRTSAGNDPGNAIGAMIDGDLETAFELINVTEFSGTSFSSWLEIDLKSVQLISAIEVTEYTQTQDVVSGVIAVRDWCTKCDFENGL